LPAIVCRASIVADWGGVFSPSMLCGGLLSDGRTVGVSRPGVSRLIGVGVPARAVSFSGEVCGVAGRLFSGDLGVPNEDPPSRKLLKSLTCPV
jgi:hypothetical protein